MTPRPSLSDRPMFGRSPKLGRRQETELSDAGYAARTGYTPATSGARSRSAIPRASNAAEEPVDGSRVTELGLDDDALDSQPCDEKL